MSFSRAPSWLLMLSSYKEKAWISFQLNFLPLLCALVFLLLGVSDTYLPSLVLVFGTKTHCLACSQNDLCKVKIWACQHTVEVPLVVPSAPPYPSLAHLPVWFHLASSLYFPASRPLLCSLWCSHASHHRASAHMVPSDAALLCLPSPNYYFTSQLKCYFLWKLPQASLFSVFRLGLFCHCQSPLVSSWGPEARKPGIWLGACWILCSTNPLSSSVVHHFRKL